MTWLFSSLRVFTFYDGLLKLIASAKNCIILQTRMDQKGDHMKMNFDYFQIQK